MTRMLSARVLPVCIAGLSLLLVPSAHAGSFQLFGDVGDAGSFDLTSARRDGRSYAGPRFGFGAGYQFGNGLGLELAKSTLGEEFQDFLFSSNPAEREIEFAELKSLGAFATWRWQPATNGVFAGAKVGVHRWSRHVAFTNSEANRTFVYRQSDTEPAFGIELGYRWNPRWSTALTWNSYEIMEAQDERVALRATWHFGP